MTNNRFTRIIHCLIGDSARRSAPTPPSLAAMLEKYTQALDALTDDVPMLLPLLLTRDRVEAALRKTQPPSSSQVQQLIALDERLCKQTSHLPLDNLPSWRQTLHPSDGHWWWFLDQKAAERERKNDLPWRLLTGTLTLLTITLAAEILKRLWDGAPDTLSVFGSLLTLTLTASPLVKRRSEIAEWVVRRIPWISPRFRAESLAALSALTFTLVLACRLLLPSLAIGYNNQGLAALQAGNLARARQKFQRAVALDPHQAISYYNLAKAYQGIAQTEEAQKWYQKSIEYNLNFTPAYREMGRLYNAQGEYQQAEQILEIGISRTETGGKEKETLVARYELLSELGRALFAQEIYTRAQEALEEALALEDTLRAFEEDDAAQYRLALPHYYLAQIYEQQERPADARQQWEACLELEKPDWAPQEWHSMAQERIEALKEE